MSEAGHGGSSGEGLLSAIGGRLHEHGAALRNVMPLRWH